MPEEAYRNITMGVLVYDHDHDCLLLEGQMLQNGRNIEIRVFDAWIPGQIARDSRGWYLMTLDLVGIRLHTGLPARMYEEALAVPAELQGVQEQPPHILIVDDDPGLLLALPRLISLRLQEVCVDTASSASQALEMLLEQQYDTVVSDIKMPGMDGLELLAKVREIQPETPTLLITGHGEHELAIRAIRGGAYDYIQKPIERDSFTATLVRAIQLRQLRRRVAEQQQLLELHARSLERLVQQRTQELIEAHAAKDKVMSLVSRELEGPISRLKEITRLLQQKLGMQEDAEIVQRSFVEIEQSLSATEGIVQELQETTLIETRLFIPHRQHSDLVALCYRVFQEAVQASGFEFDWQATGEAIDVEVDRDQITQVLHTLLTRAHLEPVPGTPTTITLQYSKHEAIISMRDLSLQMHLGVGFYVSRKILEQHNGHLEIQSFPGDRRTLFLTLPLLSIEKDTDPFAQNPRPIICATGSIYYQKQNNV